MVTHNSLQSRTLVADRCPTEPYDPSCYTRPDSTRHSRRCACANGASRDRKCPDQIGTQGLHNFVIFMADQAKTAISCLKNVPLFRRKNCLHGDAHVVVHNVGWGIVDLMISVGRDHTTVRASGPHGQSEVPDQGQGHRASHPAPLYGGENHAKDGGVNSSPR